MLDAIGCGSGGVVVVPFFCLTSIEPCSFLFDILKDGFDLDVFFESKRSTI